jgi:predicted RNA-binding protein with PUA domain
MQTATSHAKENCLSVNCNVHLTKPHDLKHLSPGHLLFIASKACTSTPQCNVHLTKPHDLKHLSPGHLRFITSQTCASTPQAFFMAVS